MKILCICVSPHYLKTYNRILKINIENSMIFCSIGNSEGLLLGGCCGNYVDVKFEYEHFDTNHRKWPWDTHFDNRPSSHVKLFEQFTEYDYLSTLPQFFKHLLKNEHSSKPNTILFIGISGIGKTTACKEIAKQWASMKILHDTRYLFIINIEDPSIEYLRGLKDLVHYYFHKYNTELSKQCLEMLLESNDTSYVTWNSDVTIIIDGCNNLSCIKGNAFLKNLIERKILKHCRLIIAVHPLALEELQKMVGFSKNVKLPGFSEDNVSYYVQQELIDYHDKAKKLLSFLENHPCIMNLCRIPILLVILVEEVKSLKGLPIDFSFDLAIVSYLMKLNKSIIPECFSLEESQSVQKLIMHFSIRAFQSIKNDPLQLLTQYNYGFSCVQEYLSACYISSLKSGEQFKALKENLFTNDYTSKWVLLNIFNIKCLSSHSIYSHIEFKEASIAKKICDLNKLRCYTFNELVESFKRENFEVDTQLLFKAVCFVHDEESYWDRCRTLLESNPHSIFYWYKTYLSLRDVHKNDHTGTELILFCNVDPRYSFYTAMRKLLQKSHVAMLLRNESTLLGYRVNYDQLNEGLAMSKSLNVLVLRYCNISDVIVDCCDKLAKVESVVVTDCNVDNARSSIMNVMQALKGIHTLVNLNLSSNNIPENMATGLASIVIKNKSLTTLHLANNKLGPMAIEVIQALENISTLTILDLDNNKMSGSISAHLAFVIRKNPSLVELHLSNNDLKASVGTILHALQDHSNLQVLNLNQNKIPETFCQSIALVIQNNCSLHDLRLGFNNLKSSLDVILLELKKIEFLKVLNLNDVGLSGEIVHTLTDLLTNENYYDSLKELHLSNNKLVVSVLQALKTRFALQVLNLNSSHLSDKAAQVLADVVKSNIKGLEDLRLSSNNLQASACLILEALKKKRVCKSSDPHKTGMPLKVLNLNNNSMSGKVAEALRDVIERNYLLEEVHLSNNNFQQSATVFLQAMKSLSRLKVLNLNGNKMTGKVAQDIADVIEKNRYNLVSLSIGFNNIRSCANSILRSLQKVAHLVHLNLSGNYLTDNVAENLASVIKANKYLEALRIGSNDFHDLKSSIGVILQALKGISNLKILDISNNNFSSDCGEVVEDLALVINNNCYLEELNLSGNHLQLHSSNFVIMQTLKKIANLKRLNLNCNKISNEVGEHLADVIASNIQLEELSLSHNNLQFAINRILQSLSIITHLRKLSLNSTNISGLSTAGYLTEVIKSNTCLEELRLGNNGFHSSANIILQALQKNSNLKRLDLNNNNMSSEVGGLLAGVIKCNSSLSDLRLGFNKLISSGVAIGQALQIISTLKVLHLSGNSMPESAAETLAAAIKTNNGLEDLRVSSNNFHRSIFEILQALTDIKRLKILHLSNHNITGKAAETLAKAIENNIYLEEVNLSNNGFHNIAIVVVGALKKLSKLKKLNLNDNKMSSDVSEDLAEVISNNNSLTELLLSNNNLQSSAIVICNALTKISTIKKLNFNNNYLPGHLSKGLADVVNNNPYLEELYLSNNPLQSSIHILFETLQSVSKLKVLNFNNISIKDTMLDTAASYLALAIEKNLYLEELYLSSCNFQKSAIILFQAIKGVSMLKKLNLNSNAMTGEVADTLAAAIKHNAFLEELHLSNNNFKISAFVIVKAIARLTKLKKLNLNKNGMSREVAEHLADVIKYNTNLEELFLSNNDFGSSTLLIVKALTEANSKLKSLDLKCTNISDNAAQILVEFAQHSNNLRHLQLDVKHMHERHNSLS